MGVRKIEALVDGLPPSSALYRAMDDSLRQGWGWSEELLATVAELVDVGNRNFLAAHGVKMHQIPKAIDIPRPTRPPTQVPKKRPATREEILALMGKATGDMGGMPVVIAPKET